MTDSMIEVHFEDQQLRKLLEQLQRRVGRMKPAMNLIGEIAHESISRNFQAGGRPRKWKPLSETTIRQRKRENKWPGQTLIRRGVGGGLMGSINYRADNDSVTLSANKAYATTQHFGAEKGSFGEFTFYVRPHTRRLKSGKTVNVRGHMRRAALPWGTIPARKFMMIQNADWIEFREAVMDHLLAVGS